jgi:hypothetical protein
MNRTHTLIPHGKIKHTHFFEVPNDRTDYGSTAHVQLYAIYPCAGARRVLVPQAAKLVAAASLVGYIAQVMWVVWSCGVVHKLQPVSEG